MYATSTLRIKVILTITIVIMLCLTASCNDDKSPPEAAAGPSPPTMAPSQQQPPASQTIAPATQQAQAPSTSGAVKILPAAGPTEIVTTSNIVADWVKRAGGERVDVFSLLPHNADPHTFQPGARDIARVADADLVLTIGLGLEAGWLGELIENASRDHGSIVELGDSVDPLAFMEMEGHQEEEAEDEVASEEEGPDHGQLDPHFWFDPNRVKHAVNDIAARLSAMDPDGSNFYRANAEAYSQELDELDSWIKEQISTIPEDRRLLVTSHDSFQYFATAYGFEVVAAVFPGGTTEREPSAQEIAELIDEINEAGAPAVFTETMVSDTLAARIAEEVGASIINGLYTGSLSDFGGDAGSYIDLMRYNTLTIVEALK